MIRVGLIGAGFIGRNHFNQYEKLTDRCRVVALCDKEPDRRSGDWSKVGGSVGDTQGTKRDLGGIKPYADWHELIADPTLADAILDRLVHNAYKINLKGDSMRKRRKKLTQTGLSES